MTKTWIAAIVLGSPAAWAQPAITPPQLGFVEDSARALRPAYGLAGNFILGPSIPLGPSIHGEIIAEAFSGSLGLLKTDSSLAAFDSQGKPLGSMKVAPGPALFAYSPSGATALAYVASSNSLFEWRGNSFTPVSATYRTEPSDVVLAISFPSRFEATLFVQRKDTIWEVRIPLGKDGTESQNALMGVRAPMLALPSGDLVYAGSGGIVVRRTDAPEVHVAASLPASFSLQQMNQDWVELTDRNTTSRFAIRTTPGREAFYQLPSNNSK